MLCCAINALRAGTHCSSLCNRHCYPPVLQIKVWAQGGCCAAKKCRCGIPKRATLQTALVQTLALKFHPSIDAQAPPPHPSVLPTFTVRFSFTYCFTSLFSVPSIAFRDCWELPEQRRLFSLLGFLAVVLSSLQRQEGGTCSRKPVAYPCVSLQPAQQATARAWPEAQ